jgi:DNA-binding LacI/PurR family transcriptional regulator
MPRARPVTLQEIADRAGVSKMTVSLALRGHAGTATATRERLRTLAAEMGYRPNPLIVAYMAQLRARRRRAFAGTIAFAALGPPPQRTAPGGNQMAEIFRGAQRRAEALGYRIEWFPLDGPAAEGARLSEILTARGILGVVLGANRLIEERYHLDWSQFALAAIGRSEIGHELHRTGADYYRAVREACQRCRARGYRRIGLAITREHDAAHQNLHRSAFLGAQCEWPRAQHVPLLIAETWTPDTFLDWVRAHRPDVVITSFDDPLQWLRTAGIDVPGDIGLIRPHISDASLQLAGFLIDDAELGAAAIDLIVEQLHHNERGLPETVKRVSLPGRWFEGRSLRPGPGELPKNDQTLIRSAKKEASRSSGAPTLRSVRPGIQEPDTR